MSFLQKPHNIELYRLLCDLCGNMKFGSHITIPNFILSHFSLFFYMLIFFGRFSLKLISVLRVSYLVITTFCSSSIHFFLHCGGLCFRIFRKCRRLQHRETEHKRHKQTKKFFAHSCLNLPEIFAHNNS